MNNGRIEQLGSPKEVYEQPSNVFAGSFLGEANILPYDSLSASYRETVGMRADDCLFIRPERVVLAPGGRAGAAEAIGLGGEVLNVSFLGHIVRYQIRLDSGVTVYADSTNLAEMPVFEVGDSVAVGWRQPSDMRILHHG